MIFLFNSVAVLGFRSIFSFACNFFLIL
jgi:hypothetical protein